MGTRQHGVHTFIRLGSAEIGRSDPPVGDSIVSPRVLPGGGTGDEYLPKPFSRGGGLRRPASALVESAAMSAEDPDASSRHGRFLRPTSPR
jgi:uridine phosphorylase